MPKVKPMLSSTFGSAHSTRKSEGELDLTILIIMIVIALSQFVEHIEGDDEHVLIRNRYDFKIISILRPD
jgi:hypothetical protein